jgi:hypothetical protein
MTPRPPKRPTSPNKPPLPADKVTPQPPRVRPTSPNKNSLRDTNEQIKVQRARNMAVRDAVKSTRSGIKTQRASLQSPGMTKDERQVTRASIAGDRARIKGSLRPMLQDGRNSMQNLKTMRGQMKDQKAASIANAIDRGKPKPGYKDGGMVKTGRAQISGMKFNGTF